jgi:hypothetical protein
MTEGILSVHNTCWLRKYQGKLSRWPLRNHHENCFQRSQKESSARTAHVDSENVKENWVADHWEIVTETVSRDHRRNPQRVQHLLTQKTSRKTESLTNQKSSRKLFPEMTEGILSSHNTCWLRKSRKKIELLTTQKSSRKLFPEMTEGILRSHNTCWQRKRQGKLSRWPLKNSPRNCCHRWWMIRQPTQPLLTHKQSRKTEALPTHK